MRERWGTVSQGAWVRIGQTAGRNGRNARRASFVARCDDAARPVRGAALAELKTQNSELKT